MGCMDYDNRYSRIEKRLNLQNISEFIRNGGDITELDKHNFTEREKLAYENLETTIESVCGKDKVENIMEAVAVYSNICQSIYFTLGLKAGAQIIVQLTNNIDTDF